MKSTMLITNIALKSSKTKSVVQKQIFIGTVLFIKNETLRSSFTDSLQNYSKGPESIIKRNLTDQPNAESLHHAITEFMYSLDKEEYKKTFDKWIERMQLCVDNEGHYFEHLMK
jgi:hypothetical protein